MPITQNRIIAVINAATDYQQAHNRIRELIQTQLGHAREGRATALECLEFIAATSIHDSAFLLNPIETTRALEVEREHFRRNARGNVYNTARVARYRERKKLGIKSSNSAVIFKERHQGDFLPVQTAQQPVTRLKQSVELDMSSEFEYEEGPDNSSTELDPNLISSEPEPPKHLLSTVIDAFKGESFGELKDMRPSELESIKLEGEVYNAPPGHRSEFRPHTTPAYIICECGFSGHAEEWRGHLPLETQETNQ